MAKNRKAEKDAAAKAKKQKIMLGCAGVAMLGLAVIQGPKLMKQLHPPQAKAPVETVAAGVPVGTPNSAAATAVVSSPSGSTVAVHASAAPGPKAILAGVTIASSGEPALAQGQLRSFSLFDPKDPFVPQVSEEAPATVTPAAPPKAATPPAASGSSAGGRSGTPAPPPAPPTDATITMNGAGYPLVVKQSFPKIDPLFVLVSLKPKVAKVGVAGGSFADGKTITLTKGKQVTLVNDATGARYTLELVYTGAGPEKTESFTQATK